MDRRQSLEDIEAKLLLDAIRERHGYDFGGYAPASLRRRVRQVAERHGCRVGDLVPRVLYEPDLLPKLLAELTVGTTEMFRDPEIYKTLVDEVFPVLRTYPSLRIWHAGCSTGEEVYSMAILLKEEDLYDRTLLYATDINPVALQTARRGIYPLSQVQRHTVNYQRAGRTGSLADHYVADYDAIIMDQGLRENIVFGEHNLLGDEVFAEMHLVMCRNVLIYFDRKSQQRALNLFLRSLVYKGHLCLGTKEAILSKPEAQQVEEIKHGTRIFRKIAEVA